MDEKMTIEERADGLAEFAALGRVIFAKVTGHVADGECDEWCEKILEEAEKLGLARNEPYDPSRHGPLDCEPGEDMVWCWDHLPSGWKTDRPAMDAPNSTSDLSRHE